MNTTQESPSTFLWVLRSLITAFLIGYLAAIYLAVVVSEWFPAESLKENLLAMGLLLLFAAGYYLMWIRKEVLAAILFLLWYASLWMMKLYTGGERWKEAPVPGLILFILAVLLIVYAIGNRKET